MEALRQTEVNAIMKRTILTLAAVATCTLAVAKLTVVTTTEDLAAIARAVGGPDASVSAIVTGVRDPHFIEAKPSFMSRLQGADLFILVGLDLEVGYEAALIQGSRNSKISKGRPGNLYASGGIAVLDKPTGNVTRAEGDVHPNGNPHYWLDPFNARTMADTIADRMAQLDPAHKSGYESRANAFKLQVDTAMFGAAALKSQGAAKLWQMSNAGTLGNVDGLGGWAGRLEPYRGQPIATYHKSWNYFAKRFGLRVVAHLEPKPGLAPTPGHLASVVRTVSGSNVRMVLQEPFYSKRAGETVAARTGAKLVVAPLSVGHTPAAKDYLSLMDDIVAKVSAGLRR
jgi:ABC-type Zn uptake system ZnuABC Zn-binding protein ZnuA